MAVKEEYCEITVEQLPAWAQAHKSDGWQFVQLLAAQTEEGTDLVYTLRKDDLVKGGTIRNLIPDTHVPSITDWFLAAFVFENEVHDLFGVQIDGIAIDFAGNFYRVALDKPMTIISSEAQKRREKAKRAAAAAAAKAAAKVKAEEKPEERAESKTDEIEEILSELDPDKAAKLRAALEARIDAAKSAEGEGRN